MNKNRFFADENSSSDEENSNDEQQIKIQTTKSNNNDKENAKRIVRSEKDKQYEEITENIKRIKQVISIRDINQVYECFVNFIKVYNKARRIIEKEQIISRFYIKILVQLEDFINECWNKRDECNEFKKTNSNNLKILRQKFRQYVQVESFQNQINAYREKLDDDVVEINETSSINEDQEEITLKQENDNQSDSSDDELSLNQSYTNLKETDLYFYFLYRKSDSQNKTTTKRPTKIPKPIQLSDEKRLKKDIPKLEKFNNDEEISYEEILKKLNEIISMCGKHTTNYYDQFEYLTNLRQYVKKRNLTVEIDMKILLIQITISFDYYQKENEYLKFETWTRILDCIEELVTLISDNDHIDITEYIKEESLLYNLHDDMIIIILKMNEEFIKILRNIDHQSQNYIEQLKDELRILSIINQLKNYFELKSHENNKIIQAEHLCTIYLCVMEHIYYKYDKTSEQSSISLMDRFCKYIYTNNTLNHIRTQANLYHIYHLSLHDNYNEARNLILMSHIQETIYHSNISTQILYNRTMVQLGLCAFRFGEIHQAYQILMNLQPANRMKELLGQDINIRNNSEMNKQQYLLPFHMHINVQLIECIYLISAMFIEISSIHKQSMSKHFHIVMNQGEKQLIFESMETMREHIIATSHALKIGDWNRCINSLINNKMNKQVWNLMPQGTKMFEMLINKIKEESLRIYLISNTMMFDSISIPNLADMFELSIKQVYEIICKMILNEELMASIEDSNQFLILNSNRWSRIQSLSVELMDKTLRLYEQNQKLNYFYSQANQQILK
ncbi:unnamed protein product [Rotaria sp. Silwood1]|nr:unnamed protein product [Rotaria sp. Silwood1]CAF4773503.1 unnamed protein product [Rotaria sp. Silwood1]